jgi:PmbA/TldA metallopeptidase C-terminal domain
VERRATRGSRFRTPTVYERSSCTLRCAMPRIELTESERVLLATSAALGAGSASSVDDLLAGVDRGLYVCRLHYVNGMLEPRRAVMTGLTRDGCFLVERGKIARPSVTCASPTASSRASPAATR